MKDKSKTKEQLVAELAQMRQRIAELEAAETERRQAEREIEERRMYLEAVLGAVPDAIVTLDAHHRIVEWNPGAERLFGYSQQEVVGQNIDHLITNPDTFAEAVSLTQIVTSGKDLPPVEIVRYRKDGSPVDVIGAGSPILVGDELIGAVAVYTDITELKRAEEALRESELRYRTTLDSMGDAIHLVGPDLRFTLANPAHQQWAKELGSGTPDYIGQTIFEVFPSPSDVVRKRLDDEYRQVFRTGETLVTEESTMFGGREFITETRKIPVFEKERVIQVVTVMRDITERKRAEKALRQRNRELTMLNRVGRALVSTLDLDQILVTVLEEVRCLLDVVACSVWLKDAQGDLVCRQVIGPQSEIVRGWRLAPGEGLAGWVALSGESLIVPDVRADERHLRALDQQTGLALRSILSLPLQIKQDVIGVVQVVDTEIGRFSPADVTLLEPLVMSAAAAIENARLYEQAQRDAETKAMLLREVNHRVKNNLTAVMGMLALEMQRPHREVADLPTILRDLQDRIRGLATVHDLLSAAQWSPLPLARLVTGVIQAALNNSPVCHKIEVSVRPAAEPLSIMPYQATGLALVVNELTTNSIKHAFSGRNQGHIDVQITTGQDDRDVTLRFHDDGPGWPDDVLRGTREDVGLNIIRMTVRSPLRGQLALSNDGGAVATITFRLAQTDL